MRRARVLVGFAVLAAFGAGTGTGWLLAIRQQPPGRPVDPPGQAVAPTISRQNPTEPSTEKSTSELIAGLKHPHAESRADACHTLAARGPKARPALTALIEALGDQEAYVRWSAALAIGEVGPEATTAVPKLITALRDQDEAVRRWGAHALGMIGPDAKPAVPSLIGLLNDKESNVRAYAAIALGDIGRKPAVAVPALATALKNEEVPCRYSGSMASYGNLDVKRKIAESLSCFGKAAVPTLTDLLEHPSKEVRWCALYSLGQIGANANAAADAVAKQLQNKEEAVATLAVRTFPLVEPASERVIPLLVESLKSESGSVRYAAAESLGEFGPKARAAVPLLVKVYNANDIEIGGSQWVVGEALKRIDPEAARRVGIE
jgi:HEAT repeat protein